MSNKICVYAYLQLIYFALNLWRQRNMYSLHPNNNIHAEVVSAQHNDYYAPCINSGLIPISDEAPALLPLVLVHFLLPFLDNAGQVKFRSAREWAGHKGG